MISNAISTNLSFLLDDVSIQVLQVTEGYIMKPVPSHSHGAGCYEIHYIYEGQGNLYCNDKCWDITPNTLFVTGPHIDHAQFSDPVNPMHECTVYLKFGEVAEKGNKELLKKFWEYSFWIGQDNQNIKSIMYEILHELTQQTTGYVHILRGLFLQLLILLIRNYEQGERTTANHWSNSMLDHTSNIIENYFIEEYATLSLENLAEKLNLSTRQTQRLLKQYYNKTFQEKKKDSKMAVAIIMLSNKEKTLETIAEELGYSSAEHFSTVFYGYYRMRPSEYRKRRMVENDVKE